MTKTSAADSLSDPARPAGMGKAAVVGASAARILRDCAVALALAVCLVVAFTYPLARLQSASAQSHDNPHKDHFGGSRWRQLAASWVPTRGRHPAVAGMLEVLILTGITVTVVAIMFGAMSGNLETARQHVDCTAWVDADRTGDLHWHVSVIIQNTGQSEIHTLEVYVIEEVMDGTPTAPFAAHPSSASALDPGDTVALSGTYVMTTAVMAASGLAHPSLPAVIVEAAGITGAGLCEVIQVS